MYRNVVSIIIICLICSSCNLNIISPIQPVSPEKKVQVDNLIAFTHLYGYVRFFHPSDQASRIDWDKAAIDGISAIRNASTKEDLASKLESFFRPIAPTLRVFPSNKQVEIPPEIAKPSVGSNLVVTVWKYEGFIQQGSQGIYKSKRIEQTIGNQGEFPDEMKPWEPYIVELENGVTAIVPLALFKDSNGTIPHTPIPDDYLNDDTSNKDSNLQLLASIVIIWNMYQHFYPDWDIVEEDWQNALKQTLEEAMEVDKESNPLDILQRLVAKANDGHSNVLLRENQELFTPPITVSWVEDKVIISFVQPGSSNEVEIGDQLIAIDSVPVMQALSKVEAKISGATIQWKRYKGLSNLLSGKQNTIINLTVKKQTDEITTSKAYRSRQGILNQEERPNPVVEIEPSVWYVDLTRINDSNFNNILNELINSKGIIFDLRGYPSTSTVFIEHILNTQVDSPKFLVPIYYLPDHKGIRWKDVSWTLSPLEPHINAKVVFLTDERAISYAETCLEIISYYKLGEIVGEPTAGTNGNIARLSIFDKYDLVWTGMKVLRQDGSQTHGIAILPDSIIKPTVIGIAQGRDEQLEKTYQNNK
jgi:C-terminal processing protease CtpA/Prc